MRFGSRARLWRMKRLPNLLRALVTREPEVLSEEWFTDLESRLVAGDDVKVVTTSGGARPVVLSDASFDAAAIRMFRKL